MIQTIRVSSKIGNDPLGRDVLAEIDRTLALEGIEDVRTVRVYRLEGIDEEAATRLAETLLVEAVDQRWSLNAPLIEHAQHVVEVAYLPGVMNPEVASILKAARDLGIRLQAADASMEYAFYGPAQQAAIDKVLARLLVNPTIERIVDAAPESLIIEGEAGETAHIPIRSMKDDALMELSGQGLYLDLEEMHAIREYFEEIDRDPTDLELEVLAQTWSEHCVHKTFKSRLRIDGQSKKPMMRRLKETAELYSDLMVSAFVDNSGVIEFYDGWSVCGKVETHNSPSAIEPYGGAMTGSGGVFRDILGTGQGAKVVASTDMFCFAPPDLPADQIPPGCLPPDYILRRVVSGVRDYGNRMGIPTNNGSVHFHPDFRAKPTVIVGAYGLLPTARAPKGSPRAGDRILALGGRTGRDGIHGATFSSAEMTADTIEVNSQAVQIGNAVEEKRLLDAILVCRDRGLIQAITDCGAGGFSSAMGEMGEEMGVAIELERAPLKYSGLAPWEIFVSESQERMVMAVSPDDVAEVEAICATYNVEVTDMGEFEPSGKLLVRYAGEVVGDLEMEFLHGGYPDRELQGQSVPHSQSSTLPASPKDQNDWTDICQAVMGHPNVASKEPIVRQYDHTVQGGSALQPFGGPEGDAPGDAAILTPIYGKPYGLIVAHGLNPILNRLDPYWGSVWAAAEAVSNLAAVGGNVKEMGLIDNFIWPKPDSAALSSLDRAVDACVDIMHALKRPFISGKDSLSSTYRYPDGEILEIPPVLCVSVFGRIPDVGLTISSDLKQAGSRLVLLGQRDLDPQSEYGLGGSIYLDLNDQTGKLPPRVDLKSLPKTLAVLHEAIQAGQVLSCHDISEGGLLACLAEMGFGGDMGCEIDLGQAEHPSEALLFNETAGCFVLELPADAQPSEMFDGAEWVELGRTMSRESLVIQHQGKALVDLDLHQLQQAWEAPMRAVFH